LTGLTGLVDSSPGWKCSMFGCMVNLLVLKSRAYFALVLSWRLGVFRVLVFEQLVVFVMVVVKACMVMVCMIGKHGKAFHAFGAFDKSCPS
jgi:hypothetical protein